MKRTKFILAAGILLAALPSALRAQDYFTLSAGISLGADGIGAEVATQIGPHIQLRAGYGFAPSWPSFQVSELVVPIHPGAAGSKTQRVPLNIGLKQNHGHLIANIYPAPAVDFFFAVGAFAGNPAYMAASVTDLPEDYNTAGISIGDHLVKAHDGAIKGKLRGWAVQPYIGLGYGRPISNDYMMSFAVELGFRYVGNPTLWTVGDTMTASEWIAIPKDTIPDEYMSKYDNFATLLSFYPTLSVRVYFNIL